MCSMNVSQFLSPLQLHLLIPVTEYDIHMIGVHGLFYRVRVARRVYIFIENVNMYQETEPVRYTT